MINWYSVPFIRVLIPTVTGILAGTYLQPQSLLIPLAALTCFALLFAALRFRSAHQFPEHYVSTPILVIGLHIAFQILCIASDKTGRAKHFSNFRPTKYYLIRVYEIRSDTSDIRAYAEVLSLIDEKGVTESCEGRLAVRLKKKSGEKRIKEGSLLIVNGMMNEIKPPEHEWDFDYKTYMFRKGIYHQMFCRHYTIAKKEEHDLLSLSMNARRKINDLIDSLFEQKKHRGFAQALLLGFKANVSEDISMDFSMTGTLHVLAVSGMHVGLIYWSLSLILSFLKRLKNGKYIYLVIVLSGLWGYVFITGLGSSILRAGIMFSLFLIAETTDRRNNFFNTLFASAWLICLTDVYVIFDPGFQLSYAAVAGIVYGQKLYPESKEPGNRLAEGLRSMLRSTLCAQLFTLPLSIYYFHQFPSFFIPANLIAIPSTTVTMFTVLISMITNQLEVVSGLFGWLSEKLMDLTLLVNHFFAGLPFSIIEGLHWSPAMIATYLSGVFLCIEAYKNRRRSMRVYVLLVCLVFSVQNLLDKQELERRSQDIIIRRRDEANLHIKIQGRILLVAEEEIKIKNDIQNYKKIRRICQHYCLLKIEYEKIKRL